MYRIEPPKFPYENVTSSVKFLISVIAGLAGWGWAGQPPHKKTVYLNQPAVLLSHINEPATI